MIIDQQRIDANWKAIQIELDAPEPSRVERTLRRLGFSSSLVRLAAATPALRRSWFVAIAVVGLIALIAGDAARPRESIFAFLLLAPIVPVMGVALSYGTASDSLHEIVLATPMRGLRLVVLRATTVLAVSLPLLLLASLAAPAPGLLGLSWLLPAAATTATTAALLTVTSPRRAAGITALGWLSLVATVGVASGDRLTTFGPAGQAMAVALALAAGAVTVMRRHALDELQVGS